MTGDPLDRIEALWAQEYGPEEIDADIVRDVLALVEVARVVRDNEWMGTDEEVERGDLQRAWREAGAALARWS